MIRGLSILTAAAVTPIVVSRPRYADVYAAGVPVVVDDIDAADAVVVAGAVAESVAFAAGKAKGPDGQNHD